VINVTSLADFKRFLAAPGATVQVIQNDWSDPAKTLHPIKPNAGYFDPKTVAKLQSNSVQFSNGGWLQFPKSAHARFDGDTVTLCMNQDGSFSQVLVYKLSLEA
jgi:hypothetical protein